MLQSMRLPLTLKAHDCEEMNVWLTSMEYSLTWVRIFLVSISSSRKGQLPFRGFFFHLFNSIAAIQFGSLVWQHFILKKGVEEETLLYGGEILWSLEVITHRQVELSLNSAAISLQLVPFLPRLLTIMGFVEERGKKKTKNFSIEFLWDSWLPSWSTKRQAGRQREDKLTPAWLCGLQLLETISSPSALAINRCKYLCVTFLCTRIWEEQRLSGAFKS